MQTTPQRIMLSATILLVALVLFVYSLILRPADQVAQRCWIRWSDGEITKLSGVGLRRSLFSTPVSIRVLEGRLNLEQLEWVRSFPDELTSLDLGDNTYDEEAMLPLLESLTKLTDFTVCVETLGLPTSSQIRALPHLETLDVRGCALQPGVGKQVATSPSLRYIEFTESTLTGEDAAALLEIPLDGIINLRDCRIVGCPERQRRWSGGAMAIDISGSEFEECWFKVFDNAGSVRLLYMNDTIITPAMVDVLETNDRLGILEIKRAEMSVKTSERLESALRGCRIVR